MKSRKHNILSWLYNLLGRYFSKQSINDYTFTNMEDAIEVWLDIYYDKPPWINKCHGKTLNLGASIASEFARLIMIEFESKITGSERAKFLNTQYHKLINSLRINLEEACAVGGIVFKPYVRNGVIVPDFITQDKFLPLEYNSEEITSALFLARKIKGGKYYYRLERQSYDYDTRTHTVDSKFFYSSSVDDIGREIGSNDVFKGVQPHYSISNVDKPLFSFWRVPSANNIEDDNPLGVSVYSKAVNLMAEADKQWDRYLWEYKGGELAVHAAESLLKQTEGDGKISKYAPRTRDRLFQSFKSVIKQNSEEMYKVFNPSLRDESYARGLDKIFRRIEFACSLAYGTISDPQNVDKTAEEVKYSKQRSFAAVSDMQTSLQTALENYIYAINAYASACNLAPEGTYETQYNWGDGVLEDREKETQIRMQETNSNIIDKTEYLKWRYSVTDNQAAEMMPKNTGIVDFFHDEEGG